MRTWAWIVLFGACAGLACPALAGVKVSEDIRDYRISGATGAALLDSMDRHGPRQGFLTRAIAQTRYSVSWKIEWAETRAACRVSTVDGKLAIIYTYPRVAGTLPPAVERDWGRFISGVTKHEKKHGVYARQMAKAVEKSIARVKIANDHGCLKSRAEVKRRMAVIYAEYEAKQLRFDEKEHRDGGRVEGLLDRLVEHR